MTSAEDADGAPHHTVEAFVENHLQTNEHTQMTLEQLWDFYRNYYHGVSRDRFKWHLIQALPESVDRDMNTFDGIEVIAGAQ